MKHARTPIQAVWMIAIPLASVAVCAAQVASQPATQPATTTQAVTTSQPTTAPAVLDPAVDAILTRLEERKVRDVRADLKWVMEYRVEEGQTIKLGTLWFLDANPTPKFKVRFNAKIADGTKRDLAEEHMFDGYWYTETQEETKTVNRREVRAADDTRDPYKLGQGVFLLPFGQSKADILHEFAVEHVAPRPSDPPETDCLKLTPRPGTRTAETYATVELWIAKSGEYAGFPIRVRAAKLDGTGMVNSYITISFDNAELNTGFSESLFTYVKPAGYQEIVEPLAPPVELP